MEGGRSCLPADLEHAIIIATRKVMIWEKAIELAGQDGDPHAHVQAAHDRVLKDHGGSWDIPTTITLETEWGSNKTEAEAIVQEHRDFLNASSDAQKALLRALYAQSMRELREQYGD